MLQYPRWNQNEYGVLKDDLRGPLAMLRAETIERRLAEIDAERTGLQKQGPQGVEFRKAIEDRVLQAIRSQPKEKQRVQLLGHWARKFREALGEIQRYGEGIAGDATGPAAAQIRDLYSQFDVETFQHDFEEVFIEELADEPVPKRLQALADEAETLRLELADLWDAKACRGYFERCIPTRWRDYRIGGECPEPEMAQRILRAFVTDYRARAPLFSVPVTVHGVAITTLSIRLRDRWAGLYRQMGLDKLPKSQTFLPLDGGMPQDEEPDETVLPGKFSKRQKQSAAK